MKVNLRSGQDFACECFCFGSEALNASGEAVRGLVKSRVEFPPAQIRGFFFFNYIMRSAVTASSYWLRVLKRQSNVNRWGKGLFSYTDLQNGNCEEMHRGSFGFSVCFYHLQQPANGVIYFSILDFFEARPRYFVFLLGHFSKFLMHSMVDLQYGAFLIQFCKPLLTMELMLYVECVSEISM